MCYNLLLLFIKAVKNDELFYTNKLLLIMIRVYFKLIFKYKFYT